MIAIVEISMSLHWSISGAYGVALSRKTRPNRKKSDSALRKFNEMLL